MRFIKYNISLFKFYYIYILFLKLKNYNINHNLLSYFLNINYKHLFKKKTKLKNVT